jgi:hypothetical protein
MAIGLMLGTPYLVVGTIWSATHTEHLHQMHGVDLAGVVPGFDRVMACPVIRERLHDLSPEGNLVS